MSAEHHPFLIDVDMDYVVLTTPNGERFGLTTDQVLKLLDDLGDAVDGARGWTHYGGPDETWTAMEGR